MTEEQIHRLVTSTLRHLRVCFIHVPMGGKRAANSGRAMRAMGAPKGFPDILILDPPPALLNSAGTRACVGAALELKTAKGRVSPQQQAWLDRLKERGWHVGVARGDEQALAFLRECGYLSA
jgi:hypothetical protein